MIDAPYTEPVGEQLRRRGRPDTGIRTMPIRVPVALVNTFTAAARARNKSEHELIRTILMRVSEDNLFSAILDDGI